MTRPSTPAWRRTSIVIVAWGKRAVTERCLAILERELGPDLGGRFELVLVDNDSPDDTAELFQRWRDRATVVSLPENRNFSGGCNAGAAAATGDVLAFLNNDVDVVSGALDVLADQVCEPGVGAAGARLLYPDGTLQHGGVAMIRTGGGTVVPHHLFHHQAGDLPAARASFELDAVTAACLVVRRDAFEQLGGYDEVYANGWEDVDLCLRLRMAGWAIVYRGDVALVHDEGQTRGHVAGADANAAHFYSRWMELLDPDDALAAGVFDGRLPSAAAPGPGGAAPVRVTGHLSGTGPGADEARALLAALGRAGLPAAAQEPWRALLEPRLDGDEQARVWAAHSRYPVPGALELCVLEGAWLAPAAGSVARLSTIPRDGLGRASAAWVASAALADGLVAGGFPADRVEVVPPPVEPVAVGAGGKGVVAVMPGHDPRACAALIDALAKLDSTRLRVVPTVLSRGLDAAVSERLPHAELLGPCSSERHLAALAASADAVVCCDPDDHGGRRALLAAAAGAAPVALPGSPAAAVLGDELSEAGAYDAAVIQAATERALERASDRHPRAAAVEAACGPEAMTERLRALVEPVERVV